MPAVGTFSVVRDEIAGVRVADLAKQFGTPTYVYDADMIRARCRALSEACGDYPHAMHYAIKANATLAIVRLMRECGARADANSGGEIEVALRAEIGRAHA